MAKMTWEKLAVQIEDGRGQGHRDAYRPWLQIHRKNASGRGNQVTDPLPGYRRSSHFMARVEWHIGLLCLYLGAWDVREQFPLWPMPGPHPLAGLPGDRSYADHVVRGLFEIAAEAGIAHGSEIGNPDVPYVATLDLAVTLPRRSSYGLAAISVKDRAAVADAKSTDRLLERLELERRYMLDVASHHVIADASVLGPHAAGNLVLFSSGARLPANLDRPPLKEKFAATFSGLASRRNIDEALRRSAKEMRLSLEDASLLWRNGVWNRTIDLDVTVPLRWDLPLSTSGVDMRAALSLELFGEVLPCL